MTIYIVRHGRTEANARSLLLGRADPALDETGRDQAARLAAALPDGARVITSPLRRCHQTALAIADAAGVEAEVDERFVELDYGDLDLTPLADVPPELWASWRADPHFRPAGGETLAELSVRVGDGLDELSAEAVDGDVVVVTHVSPVKAALAWALAVGIEVSWRCFVAQASISRIGMTSRGPSLHSFNDESHLG